MLVVMQSPAQNEQITAVCQAGAAAGLVATVFESEPPQILLTGTPLSDIEQKLSAMPGVTGLFKPSGDRIPVTSNLRIAGIRPLISPAILMEQLPLTTERAMLVQRSRRATSRILSGDDDRLLVVVGPCSIHDVGAAVEYAGRLASIAPALSDD